MRAVVEGPALAASGGEGRSKAASRPSSADLLLPLLVVVLVLVVVVLGEGTRLLLLRDKVEQTASSVRMLRWRRQYAGAC